MPPLIRRSRQVASTSEVDYVAAESHVFVRCQGYDVLFASRFLLFVYYPFVPSHSVLSIGETES